MKRLLLYVTLAAACACALLPSAAFSDGDTNYYRSYNEETAVVTKDGAEVAGRVFTRMYDPDPEELFVLVGKKAFMLKTSGLFMQRMGLINVYDVTVKNMNETGKPVTMDCRIGSGIPGSLLEELGDTGYAFTARYERYEVRLAGPVTRDPKASVYLRGFLVSRTEREGTKLEGPEYYLTTDDGREIHIIKDAPPRKHDPRLDKAADSEVWVSGTMVGGELVYSEVNANLE